jgi:hypothetical protein
MAKTDNFIKAAFVRNPITATITSAAIVFLSYRLIRKFTQGRQNIPIIPTPTPPPVNPPEPEQKQYTYLSQQYGDFADALQTAFDGAGTYENDVKAVFTKMKTKSDVLALINAYGRRSIKSAWQLWDTDPMTLAQTIDAELSTTDKEIYVNEPLRKTGYKF